MHVVNRLVTVGLIIVLWFVVVLSAFAPDTALGWARQGLGRFEQTTQEWSGVEPAWAYPAARAGVIVLVSLLTVLLLWLELRRRRTQAVRVKVGAGGEAAVTAESVGRRVGWHVDQLTDVITVIPQVRTRGTAVDITLDLETTPDVDVPMKTEEVMAVVRDVVEGQMGLQLRRVKVNVRHAPYGEAL